LKARRAGEYLRYERHVVLRRDASWSEVQSDGKQCLERGGAVAEGS